MKHTQQAMQTELVGSMTWRQTVKCKVPTFHSQHHGVG